MRQFSPIVVLPRICANGSTTVSMPMRHPASIVTVSGFSMVTPASISSRTLRSRSMRSTTASSTRSLMPSTSRGSSMRIGVHRVAGAAEDLHHVGQVIFVRGIVGPHLLDVPPERSAPIAVDPHVGLADGQLFGRAGLLLHDSRHAAVRVAHHAAVAGGVVHDGGQQRAAAAARRSCVATSRRSVSGAPAGNRRRAPPGAIQPGERRPRPTISAWPVPFCSVCSMNPHARRPATRAARTSSAWCPTTTKIRSGGANAQRGVAPRARTRSCRRPGAAPWLCAISCGCPAPPPESLPYESFHLFYYRLVARHRRRSGAVAFLAPVSSRAATASGSCRTSRRSADRPASTFTSDSCSRLASIIHPRTPILAIAPGRSPPAAPALS